MRSSRRIGVAVGVLVVLAVVAGAGWWYQRSHTAANVGEAGSHGDRLGTAMIGDLAGLREALFVVASAKRRSNDLD